MQDNIQIRLPFLLHLTSDTSHALLNFNLRYTKLSYGTQYTFYLHLRNRQSILTTLLCAGGGAWICCHLWNIKYPIISTSIKYKTMFPTPPKALIMPAMPTDVSLITLAPASPTPFTPVAKPCEILYIRLLPAVTSPFMVPEIATANPSVRLPCPTDS